MALNSRPLPRHLLVVATLAVLMAVPVAPALAAPVQPASPHPLISSTNVSYVSTVDGLALSYLEYLPATFNNASTYPLIVFLHGDGSGTTENISGGVGGDVNPGELQNNSSAYGYIMISLNTRSEQPFFVNTPCGGPQAQDVVDAVNSEKSRHKISGIYLVGFSGGSNGALDLAGHGLIPGVEGVATTGTITDWFEVMDYLNYTGSNEHYLGFQAALCGHFLSPQNTTAWRTAAYMSVFRFHPENFTGLKVYMASGGADNAAENNPLYWPAFQQVNSTVLAGSSYYAANMGEPANTTTPYYNLTGGTGILDQWNSIARHTYAQADWAKMFEYFAGRLSPGFYEDNAVPADNATWASMSGLPITTYPTTPTTPPEPSVPSQTWFACGTGATYASTTGLINTMPGDTLLVFEDLGAQTVTSITDTAGDTFGRLAIGFNVGRNRVEAWAVNSSAGSVNNQVTFHLSTTGLSCGFYADFNWTDAHGFDVTGANGTGDSPNCYSNLTTTSPNDLVFLTCMVSTSTTFTAGAGTTVQDQHAGSRSGVVATADAATAGAQAPTVSFTSTFWSAISVAVHPIIDPPTATNLTAAVHSNSVNLTWENPNTQLLNVIVHRSEVCGDGTDATSVGVAANDTVTGLSPGSTYCFWLTTVNGSGASSASAYTVATLPLPSLVRTVAVNITNTAASGTGTYQQLVYVDSATYASYLNSNLSNVLWFYPNGTAIPAWLEANATNSSTSSVWWLKLYDIAAGASQVVYMDIYGTAYHFRSVYGDVGEAPQLSAAYGAEDNGARVFPLYWNWSGSSLPTDWAIRLGSGTAVVSNGFNLTSSGGANTMVTYNGAVLGDRVVEYYDSVIGTGNTGTGANNWLSWMTASPTTYSSFYGILLDGNGTSFYYYAAGSGPTSLTPTGLTSHYYVMGLSNNSTSVVYTSDYGTLHTATPTSAAYYIGFIVASGSVDSDWTRVRTPSAGGIMPTVTFVTPNVYALSVTSTTTSTLDLAWSQPSSVTNDTLYWGTACSALVPYAVSPYSGGSLGVVTSFTATTAARAETYCFALAAWNESGQGAWDFVNGTTLPDTPTHIAFSTVGALGFTVKWTNSLGTLANVTVYVGTSCGSWSQTRSAGVVTTYDVRSLSPGTTYCVGVQDWSAGGAGGILYGNQTTSGGTIDPPFNLVVTSITTMAVSLGWQNPAGGTYTGNVILYGLQCASLSKNATTSTPVTSYTVGGLVSGATYCFEVEGKNGSVLSSPSNTVLVVTRGGGGGGGSSTQNVTHPPAIPLPIPSTSANPLFLGLGVIGIGATVGGAYGTYRRGPRVLPLFMAGVAIAVLAFALLGVGVP